MIRFDQQVALVTGAGRGLGAAYATLLAQRGAAVVVHDAGVDADGVGANPAVAGALAQSIVQAGGRAVASTENLDTEQGCRAVVAAALEQFGRLDILIHNAGLLIWSPVAEAAPDAVARMAAVNALAPFWLAQAAFPQMIGQRYGRIVFTTSGRALIAEAALPNLACYSLGKAAQLGLTYALAVEGAPHNICVNAISPAAATRMFRQEVVVGTFRADQVAPGAAFLASSACTLSGVVLHASNGRFWVGQWARSEGVDFGGEPVSVEMVAARWPEIAAFPPA